jgi:uncharacterized repeat protein (TIGR03803 family)
MKMQSKHLPGLTALLAGGVLCLLGPLTAQTLTTIYSFAGTDDGYNPQCSLMLSGSTLYGTVQGGGAGGGGGTVFKIETNGTGYATLYAFSGGNDGAYPQAGVVLYSNMLYGVTPFAGSGTKGTVYAVGTNGAGFTTLHSFTGGSDGGTPYGGLILSGRTLYGTTKDGGGAGVGTVFSINIDGSGFTTVYSFTATDDGAYPYCQLNLIGDTLYGTTQEMGNGTVFKVKTNGTSFVTLCHFFGGPEGGAPYAGVVLSGATLYGTTHTGGAFGYGNVFAVNTNSTGFTNLHSFSGGTNGAAPYAGLIISRGVLYGTTYGGPFLGNGTVFQINTNGIGFTSVFAFTGGPDGGNPYGGLMMAAGTLYGTTYLGGDFSDGSVFGLSLPRPPLAIARAGTNVLLTWTTNWTGFVLQSTPNLAPPATWTTVTANPAIVNGQYTVTNAITGARKFYRLAQ